MLLKTADLQASLCNTVSEVIPVVVHTNDYLEVLQNDTFLEVFLKPG